MKQRLCYIFLGIAMIYLQACGSDEKPEQQTNKGRVETTTDLDPKKYLTLSIPDTITSTRNYFLSNPDTMDAFLLTINPGPVKDSKSSLKIIASDGTVLYTQEFETWYFVAGIFEPNHIPDGGQEMYDRFLDSYWKSLKPKQIEARFQKNFHTFFDDVIFFIQPQKIKDYDWVIEDKDFIEEATADSSVKMLDIPCLDCYEGGTMMGYSKKRHALVTLGEHD